jgi:DNA primase
MLFVDYNQNARDYTIATVPARFAELGDLHRGIGEGASRLDTLLEWADRGGLD